MKAIRFHDYGGPEVLRIDEMPEPVLADDDVLVRVHAMGLNPVDWKIRAGLVREHVLLSLPAITGAECAGLVEAVGAKVQGFKAGDAVFGLIGLHGACAEKLAVRANLLAHQPTSLGHWQSAALPMAVLTSWQALFEVGRLVPGARVLVHGAAGGVGTLAVQMAAAAGAEVAGTASPAKAERVRALGARWVFDPRTEGHINPSDGFDLVLDLVGGSSSLPLFAASSPRTAWVSVAPLSPELRRAAEQAGVRISAVRVRPDGARLQAVAQQVDDGDLRPVIEQAYPAESAAQAHQAMQQGHTFGKLVLHGF